MKRYAIHVVTVLWAIGFLGCTADDVTLGGWAPDKLEMMQPDPARVKVGQSLRAVLVAQAPHGAVPKLSAPGLPTGATFADRGDGSAMFQWTPETGQIGEHTVRLQAVTTDEEAESMWIITVEPAFDDEDDEEENQDAEDDSLYPSPYLWKAVIAPGDHHTGNDLHVSPWGWYDATGVEPSYQYSWTVDGETVAGATGNTLSASHFERGNVVVASMTPHRGSNFGQTVLSDPVHIVNAPPTAPEIHVSALGVTYGTETLAVQLISEAQDADGDALTYHFRWSLDGVTVGDAAVLPVRHQLRQGDRYQVEVTAFDGIEKGAVARTELVVDLRMFQQLALGVHHSCAIHNEGSLWCWGRNTAGQLGLGDETDRLEPTRVFEEGVIAVSAGTSHTCAVTESGDVLCWGQHLAGLGDGFTQLSSSPITVAGLPAPAMDVAVGESHSCVLLRDGAVMCWGSNASGQLGIGADVEEVDLPHHLSALGGKATSLVTGRQHSCALLDSGMARCWGDNSFGQIGNNGWNDMYLPTDVVTLSNLESLSAGKEHSCAITESKRLHCWGRNHMGQLGDDTQAPSAAPILIGVDYHRVEAGGEHTCGVDLEGWVQCWGANHAGQLGDGSMDPRLSPDLHVELTVPVSAIAVGDHHSCALTRGGSLRCWGANNRGQLGDGTTYDAVLPDKLAGMPESGTRMVAPGGTHACALTMTGKVLCWGNNHRGQTGGAEYAAFQMPSEVAFGDLNPVELSAGTVHTCARSGDGQVACWGGNHDHALGLPLDVTTSTTPVLIAGISDAASLSAGHRYACVLTDGGQVRCWGNGEHGRLGNGSTLPSETPVTVSLPGSPVDVQTGLMHTCAHVIVSDIGEQRCWGLNTLGQVGNRSYDNAMTPDPVMLDDTNPLRYVHTMSAGSYHTCARVMAAGRIRCWGRNHEVQLGRHRAGSTLMLRTHTAVDVWSAFEVDFLFPTVTRLSMGGSKSYALDQATGELYGWGYPPLGDGTMNTYTVAKPIDLGFHALDIAANKATTTNGMIGFVCALTEERAIKCWGDNILGQLGNGTDEFSVSPLAVPNSVYWW